MTGVIQRRLAINAERMGRRCERSVRARSAGWRVKQNRKFKRFSEVGWTPNVQYTRYRHRRGANVVKISESWLTEFSRNSQKFRTDISSLVLGL